VVIKTLALLLVAVSMPLLGMLVTLRLVWAAFTSPERAWLILIAVDDLMNVVTNGWLGQTISRRVISTSAFARDPHQVVLFKRTHICPSTHKYSQVCPGYVVDHKQALDCGGIDLPSNMQYQTIAAGKAKNKIERRGVNCKHRQISHN
jgi:hypothetical protein